MKKQKEKKERILCLDYLREASASEMKNDFFNTLARWCFKHCAIDCGTVYALLRKVYLKNVECAIEEIRKEKDIQNEN